MIKPVTVLTALAAALPALADTFYPCEVSGDKNLSEGILSLNINGQTVAVSSTTRYTYLYDNPIFIPAGTESITLGATYRGRPATMVMYFDYDQDGQFNDTNEVVASVSATNSSTTLNLPADAHGAYRGRMQVDNNYAVDFLLHFAGTTGTLQTKALNGIIQAPDYTPLTLTAERGTDIKIDVRPTLDGYEASNVIVRYGFNVDGKNFVRNNKQWLEKTYAIPASGIVTIPGSDFYGDVAIYALYTEGADCEWTKVWGDEFSGNAVDTNRWSWSQRQTSTWNRLIAKTDNGRAAVNKVEDGSYKSYCITTAADTYPGEDSQTISGAINSQNKFSFTHGKVEARIRTKAHAGNFPAFWLMPQNTVLGWPKDGEIDVWETINADNMIYGTLHSGWTSESFGSPTQGSPGKGGSTWAEVDKWHVYAVEWDSEQISWYLDGLCYFIYSNMHYSDGANYTENITWPFNNPFYIILNQSVGDGSWATAPDTSFEYCTEFDYVRVYQKKNNSDYTNSATFADNDDDFYVPGSEYPDSEAGVANVIADASNAATQFYNISGQPVNSASLIPGVYIKRTGNKTSKVLVK